ncbi:MAG: rod-binding protein [Lachnospiraceae bacterium]|nr:rod-binding protein [Lachnospiraceae bacterium]
MDAIGTTDYSSIINASRSTELEKNLKANKASNKSNIPTDEEMMDAAKQFEAYMVEQVYKAMENTVMKSDEEEGDYEKMFGDMRIQQYAQAVADQGKLGLAQQLYESMKNNYPTVEQAADVSVEDKAADVTKA